jgi:hypothetical protein
MAIELPRAVETEPMSYSHNMSRWDSKPTPFRRWIVRHRRGIRIGAVILLVLAICALIYDLVAAGVDMGLIGPIMGITASVEFLVISRDVSRQVEKYDTARHQGPTPE